MPFSRLFVILVLAGVVPVLAAGMLGAAFYAFILYNGILILLLAVDWIITPGGKAFEVLRECDEKLSLGCDNKIVIKVRNNSDYSFNLELRDTVPLFFKVNNSTVKIKAIPHHEIDGRYSVIPEKRGEFIFGNVYCRYAGLLSLCRKRAEFELEHTCKVYPNLKDMRRFRLAALKKSQLLYGVKKTKAYGEGTEFESLREYSQGDDYRKINWMATARANKPIVNTYTPEKNQQVFILLDSSRVMNSEINSIKKLDYSINSSFLLAEVAVKNGDNTGLMVFDSDVRRFIKPGKGMGHFRLIAENLYNVEENLVTADYKGALVYLNQRQKRRSLLCIFTELFNAEEALRLAEALKSLARHHLPLVITIKDMRLYELAEKELKEAEDIFLKAAALKLLEEREKIAGIFRKSGIPSMDVPPDKLSIEVVNKYLTMKSTLQL
ncbi:MAG: DUF58 domain-containing protein [Clostridiales bacterium]|jgi:uncharacterized protein (DUF58 family)|nr:DUF58 domain-containing protein [Eubacteriales bacterium]MDH7565382.1 DUF58 domain-containing protein [Clostridiales bacterium]